MRDLAPVLIEKYFSNSGRNLAIGRVGVSELAEAYGTPFYAYDRSIFEAKYEALRAALPGRFSIHYSIIANPCTAVVKYFLERGCGLEIASDGEFHKALAAGCAPERILFAGPGKTETELKLVLSRGIGEIHLESLVEADRIASICSRLGTRARVA